MRNLRVTASLVACVFALTLVGCSKNSSGPESPGSARQELAGRLAGPIPEYHASRGLRVADRPGNIFRVQYSDNTSTVDLPTVARALRGVSADHQIFLFQDSPALRQKLVPGKCVLFEGLDLRKVDALALDGDTLIVGTETAPLHEALKTRRSSLKSPWILRIFTPNSAPGGATLKPSLRAWRCSIRFQKCWTRSIRRSMPPAVANSTRISNSAMIRTGNGNSISKTLSTLTTA